MKNLINNIVVLLVGVIVGGASANAIALTVKQFPYVKTIEFPAETAIGTAGYAIPVDAELYSHADMDFSNVRIIAADGTRVPFILRENPKSWRVENDCVPLAGKITSFDYDQELNEARIGYEFTSEARDVVKLRFSFSAAQDFNKMIDLEFDDGSRVSDLSFFNHTRNVRLQGNDLSFAPHTCRSVIIHIRNFHETRVDNTVVSHEGKQDIFTEKHLVTSELSLDDITFCHEEPRLAAERNFIPVTVRLLEEKLEHGDRVFVFACGCQRLDSLTISTDSPSFQRQVTLLDSSKTTDGNTILSQTITPGSCKLDFSQRHVRPRRLTVRIHDGDAMPLTNLQFAWSASEEILFTEANAQITSAKRPWRIFYGGEVAIKPDYDLAKYYNTFNGKPWLRLDVSPEQQNPDHNAGASVIQPNLLRKCLPYLAGVAVIILALLAIRQFKGITPEK